MKIVLLKDVKGVGRAHEAIQVADGHALNYLIPREMAVAATPTMLKQAELRQKQIAEHKAVDEKLIAERLSALAEGRVVIRKKVNEKGHLYDAVDAKEIAEATNLPEDAIKLERPFKEVGEYEVPIAYADNLGKLTISIEAE